MFFAFLDLFFVLSSSSVLYTIGFNESFLTFIYKYTTTYINSVDKSGAPVRIQTYGRKDEAGEMSDVVGTEQVLYITLVHQFRKIPCFSYLHYVHIYIE